MKLNLILAKLNFSFSCLSRVTLERNKSSGGTKQLSRVSVYFVGRHYLKIHKITNCQHNDYGIWK